MDKQSFTETDAGCNPEVGICPLALTSKLFWHIKLIVLGNIAVFGDATSCILLE